MNTQRLIDQAKTLPAEERAAVVDSLLRSLNETDPEIDRAWGKVAQKRLDEIASGKVDTIPEEEAFEELHKQYEP